MEVIKEVSAWAVVDPNKNILPHGLGESEEEAIENFDYADAQYYWRDAKLKGYSCIEVTITPKQS